MICHDELRFLHFISPQYLVVTSYSLLRVHKTSILQVMGELNGLASINRPGFNSVKVGRIRITSKWEAIKRHYKAVFIPAL